MTKVAQGSRESAGFFDRSVFEASQRESKDSLKRFLSKGLEGTSVTCVLVGAETCLRPWVRYEVLRSFIRGNGLLAVRIHTIGSLHTPIAAAGGNPFAALAFTVQGETVRFKELMTTGWELAQDVGTTPLKDVRYDLGSLTNHTFSTLFPIYDWAADRGFDNLGKWIESAATFAGR